MCQDHDHEHAHDDPAGGAGDLPAAIDLSIPDSELDPEQLSRRGLLRGAGMLGAGAAAVSVIGPGVAAAERQGDGRGGYVAGGLRWLAGDHHIHTQYSGDGLYRVVDQARHARAYGLDWIVITDHGGPAHARIGVDRVNPDIVATREELRDLLVFQGLEWNIPAAEHGTVFVHPGRNEVAVLKEFENRYDGSVVDAGSIPAREALAADGIRFLGTSVRKRRVEAALFLANHPARRGIDSPHEFRLWRDADPSVAIGMEGAPGHQAAGIPAPLGPGGGRGFYAGSPSAESFPGYPTESYRTWGGFDWFTATVGGLWDSLLAEGRPWWITANSDSHVNYLDVATRGPGGNFETDGRYPDPVYGGRALTTAGDFWPGFYSRTHVGASSNGYRAVMDGLRDGRVWVDHGRLLRGLDVRARVRGDRRGGVPLGGSLRVRRGTAVELTIDIALATLPNWAQFVPRLARVDVIQGEVTGPVGDPDTFTTPKTRVVTSFEVDPRGERASFTYSLGRVDRPLYLRVRGTDGNRSAPGYLGAAVDPHGPAIDVPGNADPWVDLWFYANPIFVLPH
ncbi:PHP domain-containing protein [Actinophytocola xanthii]|uniref:Histidinol-phosphatase n=1 Tax=Actinophytocola xanthii TaxID=1912961 RepID=A0A1Q8CVS0_9PSEU|nr:PHP domain-containing protein [Actinophytocola xanthii]OLF18458.1 histidinol-phosphatase [Actinophytocola xanthii]